MFAPAAPTPDTSMGSFSAGLPQPPERNELAQQWAARISRARRHWDKTHQRMTHARETVAGIDWSADPRSPNFYRPRANLIHGTITSILPQIYARNPQISVTPEVANGGMKLFCTTLEKVLNHQFERGNLKTAAKQAVRSALMTGIGAVKVLYQRSPQDDALHSQRHSDAQDNALHLAALTAAAADPTNPTPEATQSAAQYTQAAMQQGLELPRAEGLVIERILPERLIIDPACTDFYDYESADWIAQAIPMKRSSAEALFGIKLDSATSWEGERSSASAGSGTRLASLHSSTTSGDDGERKITVYEIWDAASHTVYTVAAGCSFFLRPPYSPPRLGQRWYPFFLLPYQPIDGQFLGPSVFDLTEKLQAEHNAARDAYNRHRELCRPGWIASAEVNPRTIHSLSNSQFGEIAIVDTEGKPLHSVITPRQYPPIDQAAYDTSAVRYDWELVTGVQDSQRGSIVKAKTATEAAIMQQGLSARVSEFRDQTEDWLQDIARFAAQVLLLELTADRIERIMGPFNPTAPAWDWPSISRADAFEMVNVRIRAGSTGAPDRQEEQSTWAQLLPILQGLVTQIMQLQAQGADTAPLVAILRETIKRYDERLDVEQFIAMPSPPQPMPAAAPQAQPEAAAASALNLYPELAPLLSVPNPL